MSPPRRGRRTALLSTSGALALLLAYLALWPVPIAPVAWRPPPSPHDPRFAPNDRFRGLARLAAGAVHGPEAIALDSRGRVVTGTADGRIVRLDPESGALQELARTGGRPLGLAFDREGQLYVCDAVRGLLLLTAAGELRTLATQHGGVPFGFIDDVDVAPDGTVYFSDASSRFGIHHDREDVLEHGGRGRLLAYHPATGATELLLSGLQFANGVAVAGDGAYVLVNETGAYRITRYWLTGPRRGRSDVFLDDLPGLPDNLTWSAERHAFWVALYSPRVPALDVLAPYPSLRKVILRVPRFLQPEPAAQGFALAVGEDGRVSEVLRDAGKGAYAPVTSVRERRGVLYLGSLEADGVGRLSAPPLAPAAAVPALPARQAR
ncbi:MAG: SMP-30/gluconolactonase/LRE family protein [Anaeromyxobacteraceae bacterium]